MNGVNGLSGWRWLFILEGIPACVAGFVVWVVLPDYPGSVRWLTDKEKELAIVRLKFCGSSANDKAMTWADAKETLTEWRLYVHYLVRVDHTTIHFRFVEAKPAFRSSTFSSRHHFLAYRSSRLP